MGCSVDNKVKLSKFSITKAGEHRNFQLFWCLQSPFPPYLLVFTLTSSVMESANKLEQGFSAIRNEAFFKFVMTVLRMSACRIKLAPQTPILLPVQFELAGVL